MLRKIVLTAVLGLGVLFSVSAQNWYLGLAVGVNPVGGLEAGGKKPGLAGYPVRDIDFKTGGAPVGLTFDFFMQRKIIDRLYGEINTAGGVSLAATNNGYSETATYTGGTSVSGNDGIGWGPSFLGVELAALYNFLPLITKTESSRFQLNGFLGLGYVHMFDGSLKYRQLESWPSYYSGDGKPSPSYEYIKLLGKENLFSVKTGVQFVFFRFFQLGFQARFFPGLIGEPDTVSVFADSGGSYENRSLTVKFPMWFSPSISLGIKWGFGGR